MQAVAIGIVNNKIKI